MKLYHIVPFLLLFSCNQPSQPNQLKSENPNALEYFKDDRTKLCFVKKYAGLYEIVGISNVPCTPEVENLIKQQQSAK